MCNEIKCKPIGIFEQIVNDMNSILAQLNVLRDDMGIVEYGLIGTDHTGNRVTNDGDVRENILSGILTRYIELINCDLDNIKGSLSAIKRDM